MRSTFEAIILLVYVAMVGQSPPILRAVVARAYLLGGGQLHRQTHGLFAWAFAAIALVSTQPTMLHSLSFQLSALASLGIVLLLPRSIVHQQQSGRLADFFSEAFWQTAAAQFFVLPLSTMVFGESPTSALLTNTVLAPFLLIQTLVAFILAVFGAFYSLFQIRDLQILTVLLLPVREVAVTTYICANQTFNTVLHLLTTIADFLNRSFSEWWLFVCMLLLFAFRFGQNYRRVAMSLTLVQRWMLQHE